MGTPLAIRLPLRRVIAVALVGLLLAACSGSSAASPPSTDSAQLGIAGSTPAASNTPTTAPTAAGASSPSPTASPSPTTWTFVAMGDSWGYGAHCNGCRPFPQLYADGLAATTGRQINFDNQTTNGGTAEDLLSEIQTSQAMRDSLARADIIVIATGANDLYEPLDAYVAGTCGGADGLDCFRTVATNLRVAFDQILTEIDTIRGGRPTAVRIVARSNEFLTEPTWISTVGLDFGKTHGVVVTRMVRDALCQVAAAHHAGCIDLGPLLNGPDLLTPLDVNTVSAMQLVADAILASGVGELR